jgi:hypothetical protein
MRILRALKIILIIGLGGLRGQGMARAGEGQFTTIDYPNAI